MLRLCTPTAQSPVGELRFHTLQGANNKLKERKKGKRKRRQTDRQQPCLSTRLQATRLGISSPGHGQPHDAFSASAGQQSVNWKPGLFGSKVGTSRVNPHLPVPSVVTRSPRSRPCLIRRERGPEAAWSPGWRAGPQRRPLPPGPAPHLQENRVQPEGRVSGYPLPTPEGLPGLAVRGQAPDGFGQGAGGCPGPRGLALDGVWPGGWGVSRPSGSGAGRQAHPRQGCRAEQASSPRAQGCGVAEPCSVASTSLAAQPSSAAIRTPQRVYLEGAGEQTEVTPRTGPLSVPGRMSSSCE